MHNREIIIPNTQVLYLGTVFDVLVLCLSLSILSFFIVPLHYISQGNIVFLLHYIYWTFQIKIVHRKTIMSF